MDNLPTSVTRLLPSQCVNDVNLLKNFVILKLSEVNETDYDAVLYPGGHGPLWDLATDAQSIALIENVYKHNKPVTFVCHASAALINVKAPNGEPLVKSKEVTGFSNSEEEAVKLTEIVPFLLEDEMISFSNPQLFSLIPLMGQTIDRANPDRNQFDLQRTKKEPSQLSLKRFFKFQSFKI